MVREKKVKSEHFLEIQNVEEKGVIQTHMWKILHYYKIHNTINKHTYTINTHTSHNIKRKHDVNDFFATVPRFGRLFSG